MGNTADITDVEGRRLAKGGNKWADTPFGDQWHDKCITLWCVYRYDWTGPEDCTHHGPGTDLTDGAVWIYSTIEDATTAMIKLNEFERRVRGRTPDGGERGPWGVHPAPVVRHGDEDEAETWLREQQLIE